MANETKILYEAKLLCYNAYELKNVEIDLNDAIDFCKNHSGTSDMLLCMYFKEILNIDISNDALKYVLTNNLEQIEIDYKKFKEIFPETDYAWFEEK